MPDGYRTNYIGKDIYKSVKEDNNTIKEDNNTINKGGAFKFSLGELDKSYSVVKK